MVDEGATMSSPLTGGTNLGETSSSSSGGSGGGDGVGGASGVGLQSEVTISEVNFETATTWKVLCTTLVVGIALVTVFCNAIILIAFSKFKRLRTASNCLLVSLAVSDCGVGLTLPYSTIAELYGYQDRSGEGGLVSLPAGLCALPYYVLIVLCSVSVLVSVAIAVDRLTSLAQPLRYKNIITHSSIERYIAVFWLYATAMGFAPVIHARIFGLGQSLSNNADGQSCRFGNVVKPPVRMFLFTAVWAPSALVLCSCYVYVYLVARAHAKAIYTVELSFRNEMQTLVLPRYGQTIAFTVGSFFVLWFPFQLCVVVDFFWGTELVHYHIMWLGIPVLAQCGSNPWIYAFHHGEIRMTAAKLAEKVVAWFGVTPSRYGCSPTRRGSNTNLELAEVNNSQDGRPPVQDCFAAHQQQQLPSSNVFGNRRVVEVSSKNADISPEDGEKGSSGASFKQMDILEEDIHDLTKMLDPKYIIDRNHVIDSNHNIDKIKNLKYLLDPTFNKIRHLRRLNHKRLAGKGLMRFHDSRFVSYQNLKTDGGLVKKNAMHLNTMSEPMLTTDSPVVDSKVFNEVISHQGQLFTRKASTLASVSDSNIKDSAGSNSDVHLRLFGTSNKRAATDHRFSVHNLDHVHPRNAAPSQQQQHRRSFSWARARQRLTGKYCYDSPSPTLELRFQQTSYTSLPTPDGAWSSRGSPKQRTSARQLTITPNRLAGVFQQSEPLATRPMHIQPGIEAKLSQARKNLELLRHCESTSTLPGQPMAYPRLLEPCRIMDSLAVPTIHSEPPSPIEPLPLDALQEEDNSSRSTADVTGKPAMSPLKPNGLQRNNRSPTRYSAPVIPSVLLNIEDYSERQSNGWSDSSPMRDSISPQELSELLLLRCSNRRDSTSRFTDTIFPEHDSTRFSSRRPSDSKWSESSRSQEVLSSVMEHPRFPSSFSVNNFQTRDSAGSELNDDVTSSCLEQFMCSDALSSSLRESFFSAPSVPDSEDIFTSFDTDEPTPERLSPSGGVIDSSAASLTARSYRSATGGAQRQRVQLELQTRSTESMFRDREQSERLCALLKLQPSMHRSRPRVRSVACKDARLAPLATPTPTDDCTPTFDITVVTEIKAEGGLGVRV